ncbi:hypothetical protein [Streptomyces sp. NBC_01235]|nr:hypothetical protein OG289_39265 [Streptomyces sp. NBC_01235]
MPGRPCRARLGEVAAIEAGLAAAEQKLTTLRDVVRTSADRLTDPAGENV